MILKNKWEFSMKNDDLDQFYLPEKDQSFTDNRCFLCGQYLDSNNRSDEHIFPKWLLNEFNLWDDQLTLPNKTCIQYKNLTIPCCKVCNTTHLSTLENYIKMKYYEGYDSFKKIDEFKLFLWLNKIFYGLLFKDTLLPLKRQKQNEKKIIPPELLEKYCTTHLFLQGTRTSMNFSGLKPWSIFIFNTKKSNNIRNNFDYLDDLITSTFAIRMGEISVVAVLQDNEEQAHILKDTIIMLQKVKLHPIQIKELFCRVKYKHKTSMFTAKYLISQHSSDGFIIDSLPLGGCSEQVYSDWDNAHYTKLLSDVTKIPFKELYLDQQCTNSFLFNNGSIVETNDDEFF